MTIFTLPNKDTWLQKLPQFEQHTAFLSSLLQMLKAYRYTEFSLFPMLHKMVQPLNKTTKGVIYSSHNAQDGGSLGESRISGKEELNTPPIH